MEYQFSGISLGHQDGCNLFVHGHEKVAAGPICVKIKDFGCLGVYCFCCISIMRGTLTKSRVMIYQKQRV